MIMKIWEKRFVLQGVVTSSGGHKSRIAVLINKRKNW